jgi:cyclomaltodextrinase / maltogenic alpha-amylase / neopullulanase
MVPLGKYRHFKGKLYEVLGVAKHSETLEDYVVYKALYDSEFGKNALWVRPLKMFEERIKVGNKEIKRFEKIEE